MSKNKSFKVAALAASIALAMGSTSAMAAAPTATQLPGVGTAGGTGTVSAGTITNGTQTINITGNTVINWGKTGGTINKTQPGGFNIGSGAALNFAGQSETGVDAVLNIDSSGNPSQIFGALTGHGGDDADMNIFVANANGIIVGAGATISSEGQVGLIANTLGATTGFDGTVSSISYNGTGGNVSVLTGADVSGSTVFVSGGGTVNVDLSSLTGGDATLSAGLPQVGGSFATKNASAVLAVSGSQDASIVGFSSAGTASNSGSLELGSADVAGTFTNTGTLYLDSGFAIDGALVNQKTVNAGGASSFGSLTNDGLFNAGFLLTTTDGGLTNSGQISGARNLSVTGGDLTNNGQISGTNTVSVSDGSLINNGAITLNDNCIGGSVSVDGGDLINAGSISSVVDGSGHALYNDFTASVTNGSINNSGKLTGFSSLSTSSDIGEDSFTAGADYSITNSGTISGLLPVNYSYPIYANDHDDVAGDDSTGSFINTGVLALGAGASLRIDAHDNVNLGGSVTVGGKALSATNALGTGNLGNNNIYASNGILTVATPLFFTNLAQFFGEQVKLMANVTGVGSAAGVYVQAGDQLVDDYAVRVANGVTVSAASYIWIVGDGTSDPNVILQGTLSSNFLVLQGSDFVTGPNGSIKVAALGDYNPYVEFDFTGRVKNAPYLNDSNFRYNYLPITVTDGSTLQLVLNPSAYTTNGTSNGLSAVNILVNGDVNLVNPVAPRANGVSNAFTGADIINGVGSAVTGVLNIPNTHLVLQSTGNISADAGYYWPGYVYLGTIGSDADGAALPGTLGLGQIKLNGNFSNVLPGSLDNGGGIHFITQFPLAMTMGASTMVTTNANSWINFGTDTLTNGYAGAAWAGQFFGGVKGSGNVVNYSKLDPALFQTQGPDAAK